MSSRNTIRTIYLYLFALVGLSITVIGCVMMVNILLRTYVFKNAEYNYNYSYVAQPTAMDDKMLTAYKPLTDTKKAIETIKQKEETSEEKQLTEEETKALGTWLEDYQKWSDNEKQRQEIESKRDYIKEKRDRDMATSLSMIIVGFPLYLIHWILIVRQIKRSKEFNEI